MIRPAGEAPRSARRPGIESRLTAVTIVLLVASSLFGEAAMLWSPDVVAHDPGPAAQAPVVPPPPVEASSPPSTEPSVDPSAPAASPSGTASAKPSAPSPTVAPTATAASPTPAVSTAAPTARPTPAPTATRPPTITPAPHPGDYLLLSSAQLASLPTSGAAWSALVAVADGNLGAPDLTDQDNKHAPRTLAAALVYARTGQPAYRDKARAAILGAIGTERVGAHNSILSLGRQLGAYVLAADFIALDGPDDERFRAWLSAMRSAQLGGHGRWTTLIGTHEDSMNNWGAFAGAARIAASLYLGDAADVARAARVVRGFLGDSGSWSAWQPLTDDGATWACDSATRIPINGSCTLAGIDVGGAIVADVSRGGPLAWPPAEPGISYTLESLQGLVLQVELLSRNGYPDAWQWSNAALMRAALLVNRAAAAGSEDWAVASVTNHLPWILNARYGLSIATRPAGFGRTFGYTDWLYGS